MNSEEDEFRRIEAEALRLKVKPNWFEFRFKEEPRAWVDSVDQDGHFNFYVYTSDCCLGEFTDAISDSHSIWGTDEFDEVQFTIDIKLRDVYLNLIDSFETAEGVDADAVHLFEALKKDCQWIVEKINALEIRSQP
jgi:hypothetical protein